MSMGTNLITQMYLPAIIVDEYNATEYNLCLVFRCV